MAYNDLIPFLVFMSSQVTLSGELIACTYHFYSFGRKRLKTIYCDDWEYCCSNSCCQTPLNVYRLWYFWIGLVLLTLVCITISFRWYKRYQGRVIRVGPIDSNQMSVQTVITQYTIQPHLYPEACSSIPPPTAAQPPTGPPPPYQQMTNYPELPQYTQFAPIKPGYATTAVTNQNSVQRRPPF